MKNLKEVVAQRLKNLLESKNFSQTQFSEMVGLSKDTVSKLVNGKMSLSVPNAIRISQVFAVSLDYLYGMCEEENYNNYALEILLKHFAPVEGKSYWNADLMEARISMSPELGTLLDTITNLMNARIDDDLRREGIYRAKVAFLQVIENTPGQPQPYVLLDPNLYTEKVRGAIEAAREDIERSS